MVLCEKRGRYAMLAILLAALEYEYKTRLYTYTPHSPPSLDDKFVFINDLIYVLIRYI